jgi:Bacterial transcriptional activator domain
MSCRSSPTLPVPSGGASRRRDARLAERLITEGREATAADDPATAARLLREALAPWSGRALVEFSDVPARTARASVRAQPANERITSRNENR